MLNDLAIIVISVHLKSSWNIRKESINSSMKSGKPKTLYLCCLQKKHYTEPESCQLNGRIYDVLCMPLYSIVVVCQMSPKV